MKYEFFGQNEVLTKIGVKSKNVLLSFVQYTEM